jgi:U4/U6 small nuclear ribonucleoprotein PRP31
MATLADELLADLMDSGSEGEGDDQEDAYGQNDFSSTTGLNSEGNALVDVEMSEDDEDEEATLAAKLGTNAVTEAEDGEEAKARVEKMNLADVSDVRHVASLMKTLKPVIEVSNSKSLSKPKTVSFTNGGTLALTLPVLQKIEFYQSQLDSQLVMQGSIEDNPEYKLLTQANSLSSSIDSEVILVHKFIRDHYSVRFPELERLVESPLAYAKTVAIIGNGPMEELKAIIASSENMVGVSLDKVLDGPALMSVRMEATTTTGRAMSDSELQVVLRACEMVVQLDRAKKLLTEYVQSRMNLFAPNLTVLVGSETAAQLVNTAGGLAGLAKTPSCNIANMGWKKQSYGLATNIGVRQKGFLYHSPLIQYVPMDLRTQAMRIIAAKVVLAARVDQTMKTHDNSTGQRLKEDCEARLDKLTEAAPNTGPRALPAPDDKPARKRGGRRARQAKEKYAMTDLRKQQNRMVFGKEEVETGYGTGEGTKGMGMIGANNDGRVRNTQIDKRTAAKLSKKNPGWGGATPVGGLASSMNGFGPGGGVGASSVSGLRTAGVGQSASGGSGTTSTIAFTPFQGLELANPKVKAEMDRKRKADEDRWFNSGTFTQVGGGATVKMESKVDSGGFKVPALPAIKRVKKEN